MRLEVINDVKAKLGEGQPKETILASVAEPANNRFNDGKCDPAGRFLAGTMDMDEKAASGAQITHWNPKTGKLVQQISLPAKNVTSCVFEGKNLNELFISSARLRLDHADLTAYRDSGSLMRVKTRIQGMPTFEFG